jgi:hypothetical protein
MATDVVKRACDATELSDLFPVSQQLREATDELDKNLLSIEQRLNDLATKVEVFLAGEVDALSIYIESQESHSRLLRICELGYGRTADEWALLVRSCLYRQRLDEFDAWQYVDLLPGDRYRFPLDT